MHPYILQSLAAERARDMRQQSAAVSLARLARASRRRQAAPAEPQPLRPGSQPALEALGEQESCPSAVLTRKA
jgi:hypothetical protein